MAPVRRLKAYCRVELAGQDVTAKFDPYLLSATVVDKEGEIDTCQINLDDRDGVLRLPADNDPIKIYLGWGNENGGITFDGYVSDLESTGQKRPGRRLRIEGKGLDLYGKGKAPMSNYWGDGQGQDITLKKVLEDAGKAAGFTVKIDGQIGNIVRKFWNQNGESFMNFAKRLAEANGGVLKISGNVAAISSATNPTNAEGEAMPLVTVRNKVNLLAWSIRPVVARSAWAKTATSYFDQKSSLYKIVDTAVSGGRGGFPTEAMFLNKMAVASEGQAKAQAESDAGTSNRRKGYGWVMLDGEPSAQAQGKLLLIGARRGVDGTYKMNEVEHNYFRGGGFVSRADVEQPGDDVGGGNYWSGG